MFKTRLLSGILLVIIALATIISGDYVLFFTLLAVSLIGMRELYRAMKVQDEKINLLAAAGYLGAVLYYLAVTASSMSPATTSVLTPTAPATCLGPPPWSRMTKPGGPTYMRSTERICWWTTACTSGPNRSLSPRRLPTAMAVPSPWRRWST